ncbi:MAG: prepilin-type N-terminal cleavage/methylation domain-containing protein [Acetobacteraceae bacterium]|nr:prepilin-type N-terminal cleavage/methylation domain-containing protein [Pseudomonadota bacterium]
MPRPHRHSPGFTIIEMMVVMAVLGIAMLAVPAIVSGIDGSRLRAAANDVIAHLREARTQALRSEAAVEVVFDIRQRRYGTTARAGVQQLPGVVDRVEIAPGNLADPNGIVRFRFQPDGSSEPMRIALWHRGGAAVIEIDWLTGRVHISG